LSLKCELVLAKAPSKGTCFDFREIRRRALCRTWDLFETEEIPFHEAIKHGWEFVKKECADIGAFI
jgi:hypothetical protein